MVNRTADGYDFMGMSDAALTNELGYCQVIIDNPSTGFDTDELRRRMDAIRAEQARREALPKVWVVTTVWSPTDESDSFGEYPLSSLALFENKDDALKFATAECAHHDLSREIDSEENPDDEDDDDVAPIGLTEKDDGSWEAAIENSYDNIWVEVRQIGVR